MQIEPHYLASGIVTALCGPGSYDGASEFARARMQSDVVRGYEIACCMQRLANGADQRERELVMIEQELDFVLSICDQLKQDPTNSDSINLLIGSLPCECDHRDLLLDYTRDSLAVIQFLYRLLGPKYQGHVYDTFRSLRSNPLVATQDSVLLLLVGLSQHGFNLKQEFT